MKHLDWDDYRFFAAVARAGTVRGAAAELKVNASTVTRRLEQLESRIGAELFSRHAQGLVITPRGREVAERIERIGSELAAIDSELSEDPGRITGEVCLQLPSAWMMWLIPRLGSLHDAEPGLDLELLDASAALNRATADLWIEPTPEPAATVIARSLGCPVCALYAHVESAARLAALRERGTLFWLSLDDPLLGGGVEPPLRDPDYSALPVRLQTRSVLQQLWALEAGLGIGVLPVSLAAGRSSLERIGTVDAMGLPHWLVSRAESRRVRRVQRVIEWLRETWLEHEDGFVRSGR